MRTIAALALGVALVGGGVAAAPAEAATGTVNPLAANKYTKKTVAKHNRAGDCWTIVSGRVYDLTSFVTQHPGGASRIIRLCGKNATSAFVAQHGSAGKAARVLAAYKIGTVK